MLDTILHMVPTTIFCPENTYSHVPFRLDFFMEVNHMNPDQTALANNMNPDQTAPVLICLIWFFTPQSTIFQLCLDGSSWVEPVLS